MHTNVEQVINTLVNEVHIIHSIRQPLDCHPINFGGLLWFAIFSVRAILCMLTKTTLED